MPGWQIALIAIGAAIFAAALAVTLDRVRTAHRQETAPAPDQMAAVPNPYPSKRLSAGPRVGR
jgi:hypothetical protein